MQVAHRTEVGHRRERNEDSLLTSREHGLFIVADGMGGHPAGDVASKVAVETLGSMLDRPRADDEEPMLAQLRQALEQAHRAILAAAEREPSYRGMGTTAVVAIVGAAESLLTLAHVGDSRAYLYRDGEALRLTKDHVRDGLLGRALTQALGTPGTIEPEAAETPLGAGDRVLLCTDGLTDLVDDDDLAELLGRFDDVEECCGALVDTALDGGGHDNITVVVIDPEPS